MSWTTDASGTQTAIIGTEHVLDAPTTNATYVLEVDTVNMALGDLLILRCYDMTDGTNFRVIFPGTFQHVQRTLAKLSPPMSVTVQGQFTLQQTAGTGRSYPWIVRRI